MDRESHAGVAPAVRWYRHGWNTDRSWRLILGVVPRVPPILRPPIHLATTLLCFAAMGAERRAASGNLRAVTGRRGPAAVAAAFRLFYNFSKFMVAYTELPPFGPGIGDGRFRGREEAGRAIRALLDEGRGLIVLGMHLGQWDLALVDLARLGVPITVVMRREDEAAARFAAAARAAAGMKVAYAGESPWAGVDLLAALRRNEIVAVQGDRPYGGRTVRAPILGRPTAIPAGPWDLARTAGAPILPAAVVFEGHRRLRHVLRDPIRPRSTGEAGEEDGPRRIARAMESLIAEFPEQWFNFYDVWKEGAPRTAPPGDGA